MRRFIALLAVIAAGALAAASPAAANPVVTYTTPQPQATVTGDFPVRVTIQDSYASGRCILAVDDVKVGVDYAPFEWTVSTDGWAGGSKHSLRVSCWNAIGESGSAVHVVYMAGDAPAPVPPPAAPVAAFTASQDYGTHYDLDASASTGDGLAYSWTVDDQPLDATTAKVDQAGPLQTLGQHTARLTVTDRQGRTSTVEHPFDVVYRLWPYTAQQGAGDNDPWQTTGVVEDFPEWSDWVTPKGPWRTISAVNRVDQGSYAFQPQTDDPSVLRLEVHQGDHPTSGGADRAGISLCPGCVNWSGMGYSSTPDIQGQEDGDGPRFYRLGFKMDAATPLPLLDVYTKPDGTKVKAGVHNLVEWHGFAPGGSQLKIGPSDSSGLKWGVQFAPTDPSNPGSSLPTRKIDVHNIVPGEWQDYVVEVLWRRDDSGYVKVWRNGQCVSCNHPLADADGKLHGVTLRQLKDGSWDTGMGYNVQQYRDVGFRQPTVAWYRHPAIGDSYDDVMAQG